jgi:putative membrane protein
MRYKCYCSGGKCRHFDNVDKRGIDRGGEEQDGLAVGEKAKVKETVRLYSQVWQLPSFQGIIARILCAVLFGSFLSATLRIVYTPSIDAATAILLSVLALAIPSFVGTGLLYLIVKKEGSPLDVRRTAGSVQFGIYFWVAFGSIGSVLSFLTNNPFYEVRFWILGLGAAYMLFAFLVTGLSDHHPVRNFTAAIMIPGLWYLIVFALGGYGGVIFALPIWWLVVAIIMFPVLSLAVNYIFRAVSVPFERDLGINGPELLRAFGYDYLTNNSEPMESTLSQIGEMQDIPIEILLIKKDDGLAAVGVVEYVHPGPFRHIGSSSLPSAIIEHIDEKHGVPAFVMHGSCTHQQNLTSKKDFPLVMAEIDRLIDETEVYDTMSGPHWSDLGKFKVWTLFTGKDVLTISTSAPEFTDDISLDVGRAAADMVRSRMLEIENVSIVDAHNCIDGEAVSVMPGDSEAGEYVGAISSAVFSTIKNPKQKVSAGVYRAIPQDIRPDEGMGPGGVTALVLDGGEREVVLLSLDGNNMEPGFREDAIRILKTQGFDDAEVLTTDTHVVNAISLSSRGYPPIGQNKPEEIMEAIIIAANKAREKVTPVRMGLGYGEVKDLCTFGERGFDVLTQDIAEAAGIAKRVGIRVGVASFLIALLLTFLL